jgi:hypothetical protein
MKKCPFCAEEIQDDAIKCKHCNEFLDGRPRENAAAPEGKKVPWFFSKTSIVLSVVTLGPLALPLVWFHPKYSLTKKIVVTAIIVVLTYYLGVATMKAWNGMMDMYKGVLPSM